MQQKNESFFQESLRFAIITLAIVLPIRFFIAEPFIVSGASMEPTFETGQYLIIDLVTYKIQEPKRGEVVVFKYPQNPKKYFIKRIIGLPGETVQITSGKTKIKNEENPSGFVLNESFVIFTQNDDVYMELGDGEYFVMGDNRGASSDSRIWGALPEKNIVGRALIRLFPPQTIQIFPGNKSETIN